MAIGSSAPIGETFTRLPIKDGFIDMEAYSKWADWFADRIDEDGLLFDEATVVLTKWYKDQPRAKVARRAKTDKQTDDIVTRLRGQRTNSVLCEQAADEIERLRKIMSDFVIAEREYQDACEDSDTVDMKEKWKKAWKAFTEEVEKYV